jgi:hypothetical protein
LQKEYYELKAYDCKKKKSDEENQISGEKPQYLY